MDTPGPTLRQCSKLPTQQQAPGLPPACPAAAITCRDGFCCVSAALLCPSSVTVLGTLPAESPPITAKLPAASSSIARIVAALGLLSWMNCERRNPHPNSNFSWQLMPPASSYRLIWCAESERLRSIIIITLMLSTKTRGTPTSYAFCPSCPAFGFAPLLRRWLRTRKLP